MKKIAALLLMLVCLSFANAQCPIVKPTFTVQRVNGNTFTFINTTVIYSFKNELTVNSPTEIKRVQLFNVIGQEVLNLNTSDTRLKISLPSILTNGVYIVSVMDANNAVSNKKILLTRD